MSRLKPVLLLLFTLFFLINYAFGQTKINGQITDKKDSTALPYVSVIIYKYQSNKILDYTQSDVNGYYTLEIPSQLSVITLKTSRLGYHSFEQDIVIGSDGAKKIALSFALEAKVDELQEVVIRGPIIVKEDTIIYDVEHWTEARDQTLEEVLAKIPGFKIRGDGEIEVNGKMIDKVLIDGEEISNSGAALLTRSIAPEDVKSIEVRMDEKNDKLKESLLDTREYVVLDIKLKESLNKSLFGKVRATVGYQHNAELGGYVNAFSLKKKLKVHVFAEHDRFGEQTISLKQIKNIGAESLSKMFEIPADFESLTEREAFNEEIYGFKNYTIAHKSIIGLSGKYSISKDIDLYVGSYNSYDKDGKARNFGQNFKEINLVNSFVETQEMTNYSSKNKLEIKLDKDKLKARLNVNAVIFNTNNNTLNSEQVQNLTYNYGDVHASKSFYENLFIEYAATQKLGFQLKASHSYINTTHTKNLLHNNPIYTGIFVDENNNPVYDFGQKTSSIATNFLSEFKVQYRSKVGAINIGVRFQSSRLTASKNGFNEENENNLIPVPLFTGSENQLNFQKWTPFIKHRIAFNSVTFRNELRLAHITYPNQVNEQKNQQLVEFKSGIDYSFGNFSYINMTLSKQVSSFPMQKLVEGYDLTGFQSIAIPNRQLLRPVPEYTLEIMGSTKFYNISFDPAMLYGRTQHTDRFLFSNEPVIITEYDQLQAEYWAFSFPFTTSLKKIPLDITLEPEALINQMQNIDPVGNAYQTKTTRLLMGLKLNTDFKDKWYDFNLLPKYTSFIFENDFFESESQMDMFSINLLAKIDLFDKKLLITPTLRSVAFLGDNINSEFTNIGLRIEAPSSKIYWFIMADNLLNSSNFIIERVNPIFVMLESNTVFERYIQFGIEYKFK